MAVTKRVVTKDILTVCVNFPDVASNYNYQEFFRILKPMLLCLREAAPVTEHPIYKQFNLFLQMNGFNTS